VNELHGAGHALGGVGVQVHGFLHKYENQQIRFSNGMRWRHGAIQFRYTTAGHLVIQNREKRLNYNTKTTDKPGTASEQ
jgi:hypothetical protein